MFVGVWGGRRGSPRQALKPVTVDFVESVQPRFGSTLCRDLRQDVGCGALAEAFLDFTIPYLSAKLDAPSHEAD
jgi:hypothetical protein